MNLHSVWAEIYSSSCTQTVAPLIFGHLNSDLDLHCWFLLVPQFSGLHTQIVISLPFLVFHPLDSRSWDSSVFKTMWTNSYKFFTIYSLLIVFLENSEIIMFYCFFFSLSINAVYWCFFFIIVHTFIVYHFTYFLILNVYLAIFLVILETIFDFLNLKQLNLNQHYFSFSEYTNFAPV